VPEAFYVPNGDCYEATGSTRGPWDPGAQHAGPPAALLGRELEQLPEAEEFEIARVTYEILRPVPIGPLRLSARVVRPGRRVQLVEAELGDDGEPLMRATAWRIRRAALELPPQAIAADEPPPPPEQGASVDFFATGQDEGYHTAMEVRFVSGSFLQPGPASVWLRMRHPLLADEEPTPLQRVLIAADVGNGVSATLDASRFLFINTELTVHLERMPAGEWIYLDAVTRPQPSGVGVAESVLADREGRIGRAVQALLIAPR
jgi:acyl-Coa thioesterase superfamily protein/acyl-CoA thioesterase superfamily protein